MNTAIVGNATSIGLSSISTENSYVLFKDLYTKNMNLYLNQGDSYAKNFNLVDSNNLPVSLSGITLLFNIQRYYLDTIQCASYVSKIDTINGTFELNIDPSESHKLYTDRYVYEVVCVRGNETRRILSGHIIVSPF